MQTVQRIKFSHESASAVLVRLDDGLWEVRNVRSEQRMLGHGTGLMKLITEWADKEQITLLLQAQSTGQYTNLELADFYRRFGFKRQDLKLPIRMIRAIF